MRAALHLLDTPNDFEVSRPTRGDALRRRSVWPIIQDGWILFSYPQSQLSLLPSLNPPSLASPLLNSFLSSLLHWPDRPPRWRLTKYPQTGIDSIAQLSLLSSDLFGYPKPMGPRLSSPPCRRAFRESPSPDPIFVSDGSHALTACRYFPLH